MKKHLLMLIGTLVIGMFSIQSAFAATMTYQFTITGDDLMNFSTASGADGSSALDNGLYDGARLKRDGTDANGTNALRSYQASTKDAFETWAGSTTERLVEFNLWGYDGRGSNWGEIYKVYRWGDEVPTTNSADWTGDIISWPWNSFDDYADAKTDYGDHYNEGQLLGWDTDWADSDNATSYANGIGFGYNENIEFTFQVTMDMDNPAFYGNTSPWYNGVEGQMVFWFGGFLLDENYEWTDLYEGNIILQGTAVPEPTTIALFGFGLLSLAGVTRRKVR